MTPNSARRGPSTRPGYVLGSLHAYRNIIAQMAKRDMIERYRGSMLGFLWSLFNPLVMLAIYTFVFSVVFKSRWPGSSGSSAEYAVNAFAGMIVFTIFSESVSRAPTLVLGNANLVKKVVFPLEVLPWVTLASSLFHALVSYVVLLAFVIVIQRTVHPTALLFPLVIVPVILLALGISWFLASIGVFFRDTSHTVALLVAVLMFLSPIFYPLSAVPPHLLWLFKLNPLAQSINDGRSVAILGVMPDIGHYAVMLVVSAVIAWLGLWWFVRTKHAFADVL
jgi:homopolymeric O-antigen transport system permease protein